MKNKRIILSVWLFLTMMVFLGLPTQGESEVAVGYGWSVKGGSGEVKAAVNEAVSMLRKEVAEPDIVFLFSTVGYTSGVLLDEIHKQLGKKTKVYGSSSCLGVMTSDGFHMGKIASLALMGIKSNRIRFGVGSADLSKEKTPQFAGRKAVMAAIKDAGKGIREKPDIIFITAAPGNEEAILEGITKTVGQDIPIFGGSSADNDITGKWCQFANDKVYTNGLSLAVVYTNLKIGWAYEAGYLKTTQQGVITKAKDRVIYEIDSKPAAVVYNNWLDGDLDIQMKTGGTILDRTTFHPLAKIIKGQKGETYYLSIHPLSINLPSKSLTVFANVATGEDISLMHGNWELLLNRAHSTPLKAQARGGIAKDKGLFAIYTFCAGTMLAIPNDEMPKMPFLIKDAIGAIPFIGTFTFGEQGFLSGVGNLHGNLISSMVIFSQQ